MLYYAQPGFVLLGLSRHSVTANASLDTSDDITAVDIYRGWNFTSWVYVSPRMRMASHELLHVAWEGGWLCFCARSKHMGGKNVSNILLFT